MNKDLDLFSYKYIDNHKHKTLFLLHGTGGDETDFLFLDDFLAKSYNLLGIRGNSNLEGMHRYFRRESHGVFDQDDIKTETKKFEEFIRAWQDEHKTSKENLVFLGYSNGGTMLLAMLFYYPKIISTAVILHPMLPFTPHITTQLLSSHKIFLSYGIHDNMVAPTDSINITEILELLGAKLSVHKYESGHEMGSEELNDTVSFLRSLL